MVPSQPNASGAKPDAIAAALPGALAAPCQFALLFQPRVRISGGHCARAEALLRWHHPALGPLEPTLFIPIAEERGLIGGITAWVLNAALAQAQAWQQAGLAMGVSVNISATDLADPSFVPHVAAALARAGVDHGVLELELTERVPRPDAGRAATTAAALGALGVALAIDDFGIGHSNLADLRTLPVHVVKIDRSFVHNLATSERDRILFAGMARLGASLGCRVVAEGVETAEQLGLVGQLGCDEAQGYAVAPPMHAGDLATWLAGRAHATPPCVDP